MADPEICFKPSSKVTERYGSLSHILDDALGKTQATGLLRGPLGWGPTVPLVFDSDQPSTPFTILLDVGLNPRHMITIPGNRTLSLINVGVGQVFEIIVQQGGSGTNLITWFGGIRWPGGTPPTLSTTPGQIDVFIFNCIAINSYLGFTAGLNL